MKLMQLFVALATCSLLFVTSCTQDPALTEPQPTIAASQTPPQILGQVTSNGFEQTATEAELVEIMDKFRGEGDNFVYYSAAIVKNGRKYMIQAPAEDPSDGKDRDVWMHLEVDANDNIYLPTNKDKIVCQGICDYCFYMDYGTCYECQCLFSEIPTCDVVVLMGDPEG